MHIIIIIIFDELVSLIELIKKLVVNEHELFLINVQ